MCVRVNMGGGGGAGRWAAGGGGGVGNKAETEVILSFFP